MTEDNTARRVVVLENGVEVADITEAVASVYDALHSSMDWGSNFLDIEQVTAALEVAKECGFLPVPEAEQAMWNYQWSSHVRCGICRQSSWGFAGWEVLAPDLRRATLKCGHHGYIIMGAGRPSDMSWGDPR